MASPKGQHIMQQKDSMGHVKVFKFRQTLCEQSALSRSLSLVGREGVWLVLSLYSAAS